MIKPDETSPATLTRSRQQQGSMSPHVGAALALVFAVSLFAWPAGFVCHAVYGLFLSGWSVI